MNIFKVHPFTLRKTLLAASRLKLTESNVSPDDIVLFIIDRDFYDCSTFYSRGEFPKFYDPGFCSAHPVNPFHATPTKKAREIFDADFCIWMDTIKESDYKDTDKIFQAPSRFDLKISKWDEYSPSQVANIIKNV